MGFVVSKKKMWAFDTGCGVSILDLSCGFGWIAGTRKKKEGL